MFEMLGEKPNLSLPARKNNQHKNTGLISIRKHLKFHYEWVNKNYWMGKLGQIQTFIILPKGTKAQGFFSRSIKTF